MADDNETPARQDEPRQSASDHDTPVSVAHGGSTARQRAVALGGAAAAVAALAIAGTVYSANAPVTSGPIVDLELAGRKRAAGLVATLGASALRTTVRWDFVFIAGYGTALIVGAALAAWLAHPALLNRGMRLGLGAAVATIIADLVENALLLAGLGGHDTAGVNSYDAAAVAATVKFCALVPAGVTAVIGVSLAVIRGLTFPRPVTVEPDEVHAPRPLVVDDGSDGATPGTPDGSVARWQRAYDAAPCDGDGHVHGDAGDRQLTGIGLSGGGVRAASLAMGFLQSPAMRRELPEVQYLVSVSGGGYTAGALVQALAPVDPPGLDGRRRIVRDAATAFVPGSPEEDHLRRHSSYLAATGGQLLTALALLGRHLVLTLTLLFGPAVIVGFAAGRLYAHVPLADLSLPADTAANQATVHWAVRPAAVWALALSAGFAVVLWLAAQGSARAEHPHTGRQAGRLPGATIWLRHVVVHSRGPLGVCSRAVAALSGVIALLAFGIPALIWVSSEVLDHTSRTAHVASTIFSVLLTYGASIAAIAWRSRAVLSKKSPAGAVSSAAPRGFVQILLVIAALVVLTTAWLLLFAAVAAVGLQPRVAASSVVALALLVAVVVFLGVFTDETTLSLHPFYRARIASAFAVRRVCLGGGNVVALPYEPAERTVLSRYGQFPVGTGVPHVIFAASATLGRQRTPPGSNRVSYTMCAHWVGGPDVGYVRTGTLEAIAAPRLQRDLTVQGAVAVSGAAIAASVSGQGTSWYETLLAISGVRLGAWLPNPRFVIETYARRRTVERPGMPRVRRWHYLLRELFGGHPPDGPLLQVTDGGFYDNLGLIELFRRGCTRIWIVDASGDTPPAASTLADTLTQAYQELGVQTTLDPDPWTTLTPGSGSRLEPTDPLAALSGRLSKSGIVTGEFTYPECGPHGRAARGTLVVAKASLWSQLPYPLLAYAHNNPVFPHDSTSDQFFDDGQYAAYTELGRRLGDAAAQAMRERTGVPMSGLAAQLQTDVERVTAVAPPPGVAEGYWT